MRVGFIGLGKLGLPVATAMASKGIEVWGHDPFVKDFPDDPSYEEGFAGLIEEARHNFNFGTMEDACRSEVVFVAVQTPHDPRYEGITPIPDERVDFDYSFLRNAAQDIRTVCDHRNLCPTVSVISTVLPGTMQREIIPRLGGRTPLVYNPSFIAMGTTIRDFLDPEFILLGGDSGKVRAVYEQCGIDRFYETTVPNAELIKVSYNTFIGLKLAFANTLMEVCHKTPGTNVDEVTGALKLANRRLISGAYLDGGMGDGGGCHPRDNIALSWLARELDLSYDLFEATMMQREKQAEWLADLMEGYDLPKGILGVAYKPSSGLTTGSPALLVKDALKRRGEFVHWYDPYVEHPDPPSTVESGLKPAVWLVGCRHPEFPEMPLARGSVIIDPWRYMPDQEGVTVIRLG